MGWRKPSSELPPSRREVVQGVTKAYFDEQMAALETRVGELKELERKLSKTVEEAKRAKNELETSMAAARRRQRSGW